MPVDLPKTLAAWRTSLCPRIELATLISRNPTAHKWKATYRSIVLRELVAWRLVELLEHTSILMSQGCTLGAVLLVRGALETLSILIYLNSKTAAVVRDEVSFFDFCDTKKQPKSHEFALWGLEAAFLRQVEEINHPSCSPFLWSTGNRKPQCIFE